MKRKELRVAALLVLSGLVTFTAVTRAEDKKEEKPAAPAVPAPPRDASTLILLERVKRMATDLKLTEEQKEKLKPIIEEEMGKFKTLRDDQSMDQAARVAKYREVREVTQTKIKAILTPEQAELYGKTGGRPVKKPAAPAPAAPEPKP